MSGKRIEECAIITGKLRSSTGSNQRVNGYYCGYAGDQIHYIKVNAESRTGTVKSP